MNCFVNIITQFVDCQIHCITSLTPLPRLNLVMRMEVAPKLCICLKYLTEVLFESNSAIIDHDVMPKGSVSCTLCFNGFCEIHSNIRRLNFNLRYYEMSSFYRARSIHLSKECVKTSGLNHGSFPNVMQSSLLFVFGQADCSPDSWPDVHGAQERQCLWQSGSQLLQGIWQMPVLFYKAGNSIC